MKYVPGTPAVLVLGLHDNYLRWLESPVGADTDHLYLVGPNDPAASALRVDDVIGVIQLDEGGYDPTGRAELLNRYVRRGRRTPAGWPIDTRAGSWRGLLAELVDEFSELVTLAPEAAVIELGRMLENSGEDSSIRTKLARIRAEAAL